MQTDYKPFGVENPIVAKPPIIAPKAPSPNTDITMFQRFLNWIPFYGKSSDGVNTSSWFKWYYILLGVFIFCYVIMLSESVSESRRTRTNKLKTNDVTDKKEGLCGIHSQPQGILKNKTPEERILDHKKKVSFYKDQLARCELFTFHLNDLRLSEISEGAFRYVCSSCLILYEWWILPWIYMLTRTIY